MKIKNFTTGDGVQLAYRDSGGAGVPLILVHGWGQTQAMFKFQFDGLAPHRRVITLDQRGHGVSGKPHYGYRIARFAHDLLELMDHLEIEQADIMGWSMGASVTWSFIDQHGCERIRKFIVVDQPAAVAAVPWMTEEEQVESGAIFDVNGMLQLGAALNSPDGASATQDFVASMFSGETDPEVWDFVSEEIRATPPYAAVPLLFDHAMQDWRDVLPRITVPTLVIGADGSHVNPDSQRYIARKIPGARVHIFPTAIANSHFPFLEAPNEFNELVEAFLSATDDQPRAANTGTP